MITAKPKELNYEFTDGTNTITLQIEDGKFTLWTDGNSLDFCFMGADPVKSKPIINLMLAATAYAGRVIEYQESSGFEKLSCRSDIEIKTYVNVEPVFAKPHEVPAGHVPDDTNGQDNDDCDTPYSHAERKDLLI